MQEAVRVGAWAKSGGGVPTARDYVQDGLIAMWDGIENAGWGIHDANAIVWKDLLSGLETSIGSNHFSSDRLVATQDMWIVPSSINTMDKVTLELVMCTDSGSSSCFEWQYTPNIFLPYLTWSEKDIFIVFGGGQFSLGKLNAGGYGRIVNMSCSCDGISIVARCYGTESTNRGTYERTINRGSRIKANSSAFSIRVYNRFLSDGEILSNYAIDKVRFRAS